MPYQFEQTNKKCEIQTKHMLLSWIINCAEQAKLIHEVTKVAALGDVNGKESEAAGEF